MWFFLGLFILLCISTWHSLQQAAAPAMPCRHLCFQPAFATGDVLTLQLWLYQQQQPPQHPTNGNDEQQAKYTWTPIDTCRFNITLPPAGTLPQLLTATNDSNNNATTATTLPACTVSIPPEARTRSTNRDQVHPLKARFVFTAPVAVTSDKNNNHHQRRQQEQVAAIASFDLTRIVEKRPSFLGGITIGSNPQTTRNLLQEPLPSSSRTGLDAANETMYVPYLKYGRSTKTAIRIRYVAEDREYGNLRRADGFQLRAWNSRQYAPILYVDDLSLPRAAQIELAPPDADKPPVTLQIKCNALTPTLDAMNQQVRQAFDMIEPLLPGPELDEIRYYLADERLYRFALTQIISYVHIFLDYLAFRDEIRFYRGRQNLSGVSTSTVVTRLLCSVIIFLYLLDGAGTSWVVLLSLFSSCAVEAWKVWKLLKPKFQSTFPFVTLRKLETAHEQETAAYDRIAMRWLGRVFYPLVLVWSVYALQTYHYKSWYSWFISNLANAVYTFGFISLCPQLYVNYRLKSVAHMPWKVFLYKIFNTLVDDAFAFLIDMPWKHRLMTLRDDVVFVIFLFQVYMYRVDKTRTNEYGYSYEESLDEDKGKLVASALEESQKDPQSKSGSRHTSTTKVKEE